MDETIITTHFPGNGKHSTYKNGTGDWFIIALPCFTHIIDIFVPKMLNRLFPLNPMLALTDPDFAVLVNGLDESRFYRPVDSWAFLIWLVIVIIFINWTNGMHSWLVSVAISTNLIWQLWMWVKMEDLGDHRF